MLKCNCPLLLRKLEKKNSLYVSAATVSAATVTPTFFFSMPEHTCVSELYAFMRAFLKHLLLWTGPSREQGLRNYIRAWHVDVGEGKIR